MLACSDSAVGEQTSALDIINTVRQLKEERDTWKAVADMYKHALEAQTARLCELQSICFATQAELENEKTAANTRRDPQSNVDCQPGSGSHANVSPKRTDPFANSPNPCHDASFKRVESFASSHDYGTALVEVNRLLRGPLTDEARVDGLLLKSNLHRATGPGGLLEALAACTKALELCDQLSHLASFLPRIHYQRRSLYRLHMLMEYCDDDYDDDDANDPLYSSKEDLDAVNGVHRRLGFDERRDESWHFTSGFEPLGPNNIRWRVPSQWKLCQASGSKRLSLPCRWMMGQRCADHCIS
ncbi:hypothetical protein BS50DRAFT_141619 [Corynespora cassiicola Philippines]|uniref:Uncharacterized protein n=1 Tax=Corynespora cassiicola Philippines TaxID=1448308 RepID=A0A2T2NA12_CORCC|nr:hypothetical protein BS50DRAFT_141619 [Corynespora cassiicola Philippines]